jgi:uncharacterized caspase-like protein
MPCVRSIVLTATVLGAVFFCLTCSALADKRVALVIGNGGYRMSGLTLPNPPNDARTIKAALEKLGFSANLVIDGSREAMYDAVERFAAQAADADVALFYYAGHGIQDLGKNYLMPVDAELKRQRDLRDKFVPLDDVLETMSQMRGARIVVLDACRDNEAVEALRVATRSTSISRGLAAVQKVTGMLIAFATQPDRVAADGGNGNSPFTQALVGHLAEPGIELRTALTRVRRSVASVTHDAQVPEVWDSLLGEIYLKPALPTQSTGESSPKFSDTNRAPVDAAPPAKAQEDRSAEIAFWN